MEPAKRHPPCTTGRNDARPAVANQLRALYDVARAGSGHRPRARWCSPHPEEAAMGARAEERAKKHLGSIRATIGTR